MEDVVDLGLWAVGLCFGEGMKGLVKVWEG